MAEDFKKNYIEEQKRIESERAARLAKIGMGGNGAVGEGTTVPRRTSPTNSAPAPQRRTVQRPVPPTVNTAPRRTVDENGEIVTRRPAATGASVANGRPAAIPQRRPAANENLNRAASPMHSTERPVNTPARRTAAPAAIGQSAGRSVNPQRTSENVRSAGGANAQRPSSPAVNRRPPVNNRNGAFDADEKQFKRRLSDDENRAMMFALTGKAQEPDDGGEVDLIDIGRINTGRKTSSPAQPGAKVGGNAGKYVGRFFISFFTFIMFIVVAVYSALLLVAHGPSETIRDLLVQSAEQASATKWVPYLVLPKDTVLEIINRSEEVVQDSVSIDDYNSEHGGNNGDKTEDEWEKAQDGVIFETVNGSTYKAYVLLVRDPTRVFVGTSTDDFSNSTAGVNIFQAAQRYGALACINGGEFLDNGGHGSGYAPLGLTFSKGECVFDDGSVKTFMGFTNDNVLVVRESMTAAEAKALGIRDAVSFQNGNTLIEKKDDKLVMYYADGNTGTSQRSAIGQREDGTVILIVTDGRTASSPGATHNDMIDLMVSYGAVSAGMLDGGSSAMMYYKDYYDKYDIDKSKLDQYQLQGLVNNYKAFTEPRRIPTFFMVSP